MRSENRRFWEIDFSRGIALVMMLVYHFLVDLEYLNPGLSLTSNIFWNSFQKLTATLFLVVAGLALSICYSRMHPTFRFFGTRGLKIFGWGCLVTVVTRFVLAKGYVIFGILHLIGLSTILAYPFFRLKKANLPIAVSMVTLGSYLNRLSFPFTSWVWIGLTPNSFYSVDYFPLFPWFGLVIFGLFLGQTFYPRGYPVFHLRDYSAYRAVYFITFLGKHTLPVYLLHQPLFLAGIYLYLHFTKIPF